MGLIEAIVIILILILVIGTAFSAPIESKAYFKAMFKTGGVMFAKTVKFFNHKSNNTVINNQS